MSQATGAGSQFVLGFEPAFKTLASAGFVMPINTSGVKGSRNQNSPGTLRGNRNPVEPFNGNLAAGGQVVVPVDSSAMWYWLKAAFGDPVTTGTGPYVHTFKAGNTRPFISIEHRYLDLVVAKYFQYTGCKINGMAVSTGDDGELLATIDIVGSAETIATTSFHAGAPEVVLSRLENLHATLSEGGTAFASGKLADFQISWNCDTSQYVIGGGGVLGSLPDGIMAVTGNLSSLFQDTALVDKAVNSTESSIDVTYTGSASSILSIKFPELKYGRNSPGIPGPQGIAVELPWSAYYKDASEATSVQVTLTNNDEHAA